MYACVTVYIYINIRVYKMICFQPPGYLWNPENNPENPQPSKLLSVVSAVSFLTELTPCVAVQTGQLDNETWQSPHVSSNESFAHHFDLQKKSRLTGLHVWLLLESRSSLGTIFWDTPHWKGAQAHFWDIGPHNLHCLILDLTLITLVGRLQ